MVIVKRLNQKYPILENFPNTTNPVKRFDLILKLCQWDCETLDQHFQLLYSLSSAPGNAYFLGYAYL